MKQVDIKIINTAGLDLYAKIDGKVVKTKVNRYGHTTIHHETEKDEIEISLCSFYELQSKWWFLTSIFFFIISAFGILDQHKKKNNYVFTYQAKMTQIKPQESVKIILKKQKDETTKAAVEGTATLQESINSYKEDPIIDKRRTILKFTKLGLWVALIAVCILIVVLKFGK